jgi:hypothetical protein
MTVHLAGAVRRPTPLARKRWGPALVLAAVVATACAEEKPYFGTVVTLKLKDPELDYRIVDRTGVEQKIPGGTTEVTVRVSGGKAKTITVNVYDANGTPCITVVVDLRTDGPYEVNVKCSREDAGAPPPTPDAEVAPDAGPDTSPDTGPSAQCAEYCTVMGKRCPGVYLKPGECLETCASFGWGPGQRGSADNTVGCRIGAALMASKPDELPFCYQAGPTGGRFCDPLCFNYCDAAALNCQALLTGGSWQECRRLCVEPDRTIELRSDRGDTLECKIFWMGEAGKDNGASCARLAAGPPSSPCQ